MERITAIALAALLTPSVAAAQSPVIWWQVSDDRMENVMGHDAQLAPYESAVTDHRVAVERRVTAEGLAETFLDDAREQRSVARKARRKARKEVRRARRGKGDLMLATRVLADVRRDVMEADDLVVLQKQRIEAREEHVDLERARYKRARARLELEESRMLRAADARGSWWHNPDRYENQLQRITDRTREERSEWDLARVDVREKAQDHYDPAEHVAWQTIVMPVPADPSDSAMQPTSPDWSSRTADPGESDLRRVHFDLGSDELDAEALNTLSWNAHVLRNNRGVAVRIEGHTDATGTMSFNRELAWDRAEAIEAYLHDSGVWDSQLETVAYGELVPLVATDVNRRAEFVVLEEGDGLVEGTLDNELVMDDWN